MCSRVDGVEVLIYALGLAMSGKNPTMPPRNSSELASDSVLSKRSALTAVLGCRGVALRGSWKAWQSARLHAAHTSRRPEGAIEYRCGVESWQQSSQTNAVTSLTMLVLARI